MEDILLACLLLSGAAQVTSVSTNSTCTSSCTGVDVCSCHPQYTPDSSSSSRLLPTFPPRLSSTTPSGLPAAMYTSSYDQSYVPLGPPDPSAFYSPLANTYDLTKDGMTTAGSTWGSTTGAYHYDPTAVAPMSQYPYSNGYGPVDINGSARRKNATRETTNTLKAWLYEHRKNPYPTKGEKIMLAIITKMTLTQVSTWFANARRRLKKENKMTWSPRNRCGDADEDDLDDKDDDAIDSLNDEKVICKKELPENKEKDNSGEGYDSGNDCGSSSLNAGSLSTPPKPLVEGSTIHAGPPHVGLPRPNYGIHQGHHHHHQLPQINNHQALHPSTGGTEDASANADMIASKPKIWSLAQTATSCAQPYPRRICASPSDAESAEPTAAPIEDIAYHSRIYVNGFPPAQNPQSKNVSEHINEQERGKNGISADIDCYHPSQTLSWLSSATNSMVPCYGSSIYSNNMDDSSGRPVDKSSGALNSHMMCSQADTPPQTPPSVQGQQIQHHLGQAIDNNNIACSMVSSSSTTAPSQMTSYTTDTSSSNSNASYASSFQGLKSMFDQSPYLSVNSGFKPENEVKSGSLPIR